MTPNKRHQPVEKIVTAFDVKRIATTDWVKSVWDSHYVALLNTLKNGL